MRSLNKFALFFLVWPFIAQFSQPDNFPILKGPYLGQKPPGMTPEIFAPGILSTGSHELDITLTPDGEEIFFTRSGPDWFSSILQFKMINNKWIGPLMPVFSGKTQNNYPFVTPDGRRIVYNSQNPIKSGQTEGSRIFVATKTSGDWSDGVLLDSTLNRNGTEMFVSVAANGNIYFGARYDNGIGGCDIYMCKYLNGNYSNSINIGRSINTEHNEFHAFVSPDESYLLFDSNRPGTYGANDLYISYKLKNGTWSMAQNLGDSINTKSSESRPYISTDGKYLFFCSTRVYVDDNVSTNRLTYGEFEKRINGPGNGNQDIYWVSAKFVEELRPKEQIKLK